MNHIVGARTARKCFHAIRLALVDHALVADRTSIGVVRFALAVADHRIRMIEVIPISSIAATRYIAFISPLPGQIIGAISRPLDQKVDALFCVQPIEDPEDRGPVGVSTAAADDDPHSSPRCWRSHSTLPGW